MSVRVAILGAAGYGGQELLRLLASHPHFDVAGAGSRAHAGKSVEEVLPQLRGSYPDLRFLEPVEAAAGCEAVFLAVPHGAARTLFDAIDRDSLKVVDLSMDFRLESPDHDFVYGLTETNRARIANARCVANPGCFATGALLALAPLAELDLIETDVDLSQTTGSSGSGAESKLTTHHPERAQDMRAYKVLEHQHEAEIAEELARLGAPEVDLAMVPQSGPFARGIFTVAHVRLRHDTDLGEIYARRYGQEPFLRMRHETPTLRHVARTNFCDIAVAQKSRRAVILTALDNLVKGMSGQAIQNMNLLCGLEETTGLMAPGANP
ncbi:MAG: N-acetyl-gamma-glutamyl-phosphate reductase [Planctomycetota bacterium]|jgi:N-acetyl-gamma-glutamyl-phosphate reductase|nr:N-acetyl-gamma-glutamyl-phosphate reductase [Planctomycetota bacterium]